MARSIVPVNIRPHLIPFLYQEFEGVEASYIKTKVKAAKISTRSNLGKIIRLLMEKTDMPEKVENFNMFLNVQDQEQSKFFGSVFKAQSGKNTFLRLPPEAVKFINDYLEDMFRLSFVAFVVGYTSETKQKDIFAPNRNPSEAIDIFIESYNLLEHGFCRATLHRYYYREISSDNTLKRIQRAVGNRSLHYV